MNHSEQAEKVARETGWDIDDDAKERGWSGISIGPVGRHRDSEVLERSNFDVIYEDLDKRFGADVDIANFGHWAVGWVEEIIWNSGNKNLAKAVAEWGKKLESYPVADEDDFSEKEMEEQQEYWDSWGRSQFENALVEALEEQGWNIKEFDPPRLELDRLFHDIQRREEIWPDNEVTDGDIKAVVEALDDEDIDRILKMKGVDMALYGKPAPSSAIKEIPGQRRFAFNRRK